MDRCGVTDPNELPLFEGGTYTPETPRVRYGEMGGAVIEVFGRPRDDGDVLPASDCAVMLLPSSSSDVGRAIRDESRRVLNYRGHEVFFVPTTRGAICIIVSPDVNLGCGSPFHWGMQIPEKDPSTFAGVLTNDAIGVDVVISGHHHHAVLGDNVFFLELDETFMTDLSFGIEFVVMYRGGSKQRWEA